jgi:hypothetical protein
MENKMKRTKAEHDIAFIRQVIEDSRRALVENGLPYIIWGALSILGTVLTYGAVALQWFGAIPWIWVGFGILGGAGTFLALRARGRRPVKSAAGLIYTGVWIGMLLLDLVIALCLYLAGIRDMGLYLAIASGGLGMAYFVSSAVTRNPFMFVLSFGWWAGSVAMVLAGGRYAPLMLAGLVLVCELIPGIMLYARRRRPAEQPDEAVDG